MQYAYDQLGRLISAATAGDGGWGLAWNYDGFGNLYQQSVTKGTAPSFNIGVDGATNRAGGTHDANGNLLSGAGISNSYDVDNRLIATSRTGHSAAYHYSARNERIVVYENGAREFHFYGVDGLLLGVYTPASEAFPHPVRVGARERVYFHGRLLMIGIDWVATDRLGSVVRKGTTNYKYAPYGQEIGGTTENNTAKFATYTRDTASGYDYALNRYYNSQWGRFTSPDPYQASGGPADPGSWNRYAYVGGDPVNYYDPPGLSRFIATGTWDGIPGSYEVSNVDCLTRIDMGFMGGIAFCASAGGWVQEPKQEPRGGTPEAQCDIQLKYQDVASVPGYGNHAFLAVVGRDGGWRYIEGLPERADYGNWGSLRVVTGSMAPGSEKAHAPIAGGRLNASTNSFLFNSQICDLVDRLCDVADRYMESPVAYNGRSANPLSPDHEFGPNSNTLIRHLLVGSGLINLTTTPVSGRYHFVRPPQALGWGNKIP